MAGDDSFCDLKLVVPLTNGIILERADTGAVVTNVPHLVVEHSPTGFGFGGAGSGPADLALNIIEAALRKMDWQGEKVRCFDGQCFALARELYQEFKWQFIANVPREGAVISYEVVEDWVKTRLWRGEVSSESSADQILNF